ncbi:MAG TPA: hypothetical protein PLX02_05000 [Syntrophorhabdaceae bacterium]|nr:hypothetical protein [Syntrophorhabdaceae bacterium]HQM80961.1 hypothetical protein [Syntrophorhabdaceae bacterium]
MKRKAIVIFRILGVAVPFLIIAKSIFRFDTYFVEKDTIEKINDREGRGIKWIKKEYKEFSEHVRGMFIASGLVDEIYEKVRKSSLYHYIEKVFARSESHKKKMEVVWKYYLFRGIGAFADQYAAALYLKNMKGYNSITIVCCNSLAYFIKRKKEEGLNIYIFPGLFFFKGAEKVRLLVSSKMKFLTKRFLQGKKIQGTPLPEEQYRSRPFDLKDMKVLYFPHQGIFYGDLFKKDHFYSDDAESPLHKSKILHISLGEKNAPYMPENYQYYVENDIPFTDINDIGYDKEEFIKSIFKLFLSMNIKILADLIKYGLWYVVYGLFLFISIKRYCLIFSRFVAPKVALVGYDHLFPRNLAMALSLLDIKVCGTQERFIFAFWPDQYYIFDHYFVAGRVVIENGLKSCFINHCIPIGMVREDLLYHYATNNIFDEKYDTIKKGKKLVLALDFHVPDDEIEDISRSGGKVRYIRQFYRDLIRLAIHFPLLHIVIKGKIVESYQSPYIMDIVDEIEKIENLEIELDLKKYDPYFLSEKADLTIAGHTSLCDELIAADRKVIVYEFTDHLETLFDYDHLPIVVTNYEQLERHVIDFLEGVHISESKMRTMQEKYYANCFHGNVQKTVRRMIEKIIEA